MLHFTDRSILFKQYLCANQTLYILIGQVKIVLSIPELIASLRKCLVYTFPGRGPKEILLNPLVTCILDTCRCFSPTIYLMAFILPVPACQHRQDQEG
jgi:hypothetical protein